MTAKKQWKGFQGPAMPWEDNLVFARIADQRGTMFAFKVWKDLHLFIRAGVTPLVRDYRVGEVRTAEVALDIYREIMERDGEDYMLAFYQTMRNVRLLGEHVRKIHRCTLPPSEPSNPSAEK